MCVLLATSIRFSFQQFFGHFIYNFIKIVFTPFENGAFFLICDIINGKNGGSWSLTKFCFSVFRHRRRQYKCYKKCVHAVNFIWSVWIAKIITNGNERIVKYCLHQRKTSCAVAVYTLVRGWNSVIVDLRRFYDKF